MYFLALISNAIILKVSELYCRYYANIHPMVIVGFEKNYGQLTQCHRQQWVFSSPLSKGATPFFKTIYKYH
jgi:hypothetical protein